MSAQAKIRILSVDDHPMVREGMAGIINRQPDMLLVAEAATIQKMGFVFSSPLATSETAPSERDSLENDHVNAVRIG